MLVACETVEDVLNIINEQLNSFNVVNIGTSLYKLSTLASIDSTAQIKLRGKIRRDLRFRSLIHQVTALLNSAAILIRRELNDTNSQTPDLRCAALAPKELSNIVWAITKLGAAEQELFDAIAEHTVWFINYFDSINLSLTLWGFAKMDMSHPELFAAARSRIERTIREFEPHRVCNAAWAYAKTGNADANKSIFDAIASACSARLSDYTFANQSMLFYSFALAHHTTQPTLMNRLLTLQEIEIRRGKITDPRSLVNLVWGAAELGLHTKHSNLYSSVCELISRTPYLLTEFTVAHMGTLCLGLVMAKTPKFPALLNTLHLLRDECARRVLDSSMHLDLTYIERCFRANDIQDLGCVAEALEMLRGLEEREKDNEEDTRPPSPDDQANTTANEKDSLGTESPFMQVTEECYEREKITQNNVSSETDLPQEDSSISSRFKSLMTSELLFPCLVGILVVMIARGIKMLWET